MRLQFYLRRDVARKIEHVGNVLGQPTGKAAAFLLDGASGCERQAGDVLSECVRERRDEAQLDRPPVVRLFGAPPEEVVLLQVPLAVDVAERIGRIARQQALPRAKACAWLLDRAVDDPLWIVDIVRSRLVAALLKPQTTENKPRLAAKPR